MCVCVGGGGGGERLAKRIMKEQQAHNATAACRRLQRAGAGRRHCHARLPISLTYPKKPIASRSISVMVAQSNTSKLPET